MKIRREVKLNYKIITIVLLSILLLSSFLIIFNRPKQTFPALAFAPVMCGNNDGTMWMLRDGSLSREVGISGSSALEVYSGKWRDS